MGGVAAGTAADAARVLRSRLAPTRVLEEMKVRREVFMGDARERGLGSEEDTLWARVSGRVKGAGGSEE
jgi:hypothetical protein